MLGSIQLFCQSPFSYSMLLLQLLLILFFLPEVRNFYRCFSCSCCRILVEKGIAIYELWLERGNLESCFDKACLGYGHDNSDQIGDQ